MEMEVILEVLEKSDDFRRLRKVILGRRENEE